MNVISCILCPQLWLWLSD